MKLPAALIPMLILTFSMPETNYRKTPAMDLPNQKPLFSFGIITDVQYCDCDPEGSRHYRSSIAKLKEAVSVLAGDSVGFVINLGDLIEEDFSSYKPVMNILDASGLKVYHLIGNHDYEVEPRMKRRIPPLQNNRDGYYSFKVGEFRFIMLNGNDVSTYASNNSKAEAEAVMLIEKLRSEGEPNAINWNGGLGQVQLDWLGRQLDEASSGNEPVFIFCHFPAWPENLHNLLNYREVLAILEKYSNIIAWFSGHNHAGNYGNFNMIHFVTLKGMVETEKDNSFSIVEVYRNKLWIKGAGREKSQILAY